MPAFTFEKLSAPASHGPAPAVAEKPRSRLAGLVNRLVEPRIRRPSGGQPEASDSRAKPQK
jgi:hypothetical protein